MFGEQWDRIDPKVIQNRLNEMGGRLSALEAKVTALEAEVALSKKKEEPAAKPVKVVEPVPVADETPSPAVEEKSEPVKEDEVVEVKKPVPPPAPSKGAPKKKK